MFPLQNNRLFETCRHWAFGLAVIPLALLWPFGDQGSPLLERQSVFHYVIGIVASGVFIKVIPMLFGKHQYDRRALIKFFLFTGGVGVLLLHGIHWLAIQSRTNSLHGTLDASFVSQLIKLIDLSYRAAEDPTANFVQSLLGFTFGVGLAEEFVKVVPVWFVLERDPLAERNDALIVGLVSGAAFGVAEGIHYSAHYYNGTSPLLVYLTRFVSCVALHAAFSGSCALLIERKRETIFAGDNIVFVAVLVLVQIVPVMILHGLYDTLLKMDLFGTAVLTAVATFVFLNILIERNRASIRREKLRDELWRIRSKAARVGMDSLTAAEFQTLQRARRATRSTKHRMR